MTNSRAGSSHLALGTPANYTIASGIITVTRLTSYITINGEGASSDDLVTINGGVEGDILVCRAQASAQDITFKNGTGNILLDADRLTSTTQNVLTLIYNGSNWLELSWAIP